jgi:hypothetical protein
LTSDDPGCGGLGLVAIEAWRHWNELCDRFAAARDDDFLAPLDLVEQRAEPVLCFEGTHFSHFVLQALKLWRQSHGIPEPTEADEQVAVTEPDQTAEETPAARAAAGSTEHDGSDVALEQSTAGEPSGGQARTEAHEIAAE